MSDASAPVTVALDEHGVLTVTLDDGKANALSNTVLGLLEDALDRAAAEAQAVVLAGRPGRFSAGFDLSVMQEGPEAARDLVRRGALLALRTYELECPVVVACTGHALAMGAIMLMAADVRVGAGGDFKIGLNEVAIGMPVPAFAVELARDRLSRRHLTRAVNLASIYDPEGALDAGFLDEVVEPGETVDVARDRARQLAGTVQPTAFAATRENLRRATAQLIRDTLDADIARFTVDA